jgi:hypothetical protein
MDRKEMNMNRKILSAVILAAATSLSVPWALADGGGYSGVRGGGDGYRGVRGAHVEKHHYYHHDRGHHRGWHQPRHHGHHGYYQTAPRYHREHYNSYPQRRSASPMPIIAGSVIGGVVGHEIGRGDPRDTAVGAVVGTVIGYQIVRNRDW